MGNISSKKNRIYPVSTSNGTSNKATNITTQTDAASNITTNEQATQTPLPVERQINIPQIHNEFTKTDLYNSAFNQTPVLESLKRNFGGHVKTVVEDAFLGDGSERNYEEITVHFRLQKMEEQIQQYQKIIERIPGQLGIPPHEIFSFRYHHLYQHFSAALENLVYFRNKPAVLQRVIDECDNIIKAGSENMNELLASLHVPIQAVPIQDDPIQNDLIQAKNRENIVQIFERLFMMTKAAEILAAEINNTIIHLRDSNPDNQNYVQLQDTLTKNVDTINSIYSSVITQLKQVINGPFLPLCEQIAQDITSDSSLYPSYRQNFQSFLQQRKSKQFDFTPIKIHQDEIKHLLYEGDQTSLQNNIYAYKVNIVKKNKNIISTHNDDIKPKTNNFLLYTPQTDRYRVRLITPRVTQPSCSERWHNRFHTARKRIRNALVNWTNRENRALPNQKRSQGTQTQQM